MDADLRRRLLAVGLSLISAFLWAAYYAFVLGLSPGIPPSGLLFWPFAFGGLGYLTWVIAGKHGAAFRQLFRSPSAWARVALLLTMQLAVLAETFLAGPVDTSLLSLLGDVVITPFLVMVALNEGRHRARDPWFLGGVVAATLGATLTIVASGTVRPLTDAAAAVAVLVPFVVAVYFLSAAQENRRLPTSAVVAHATVFAALAALLVLPFVPGGLPGLGIPSVTAGLLLAALGLTSFFVAPALYFRAIEEAGIVLPAVLMATIPVFTLLLSAALFREVPPLLALVGIPLAVVGAILALQGAHPAWTRTYGTATAVEPPAGPA
ncbi:MAG: DMT family transporter [Thermoplasmata archaeon]|nr:DMT family transporter [Thermoplasmata archaeon]